MLISTRGRYALRILVDLAEHQADGYVTRRELADRQDISEKYLESIAKQLVSCSILAGVRGKGGGYRLGRAPEDIRVLDVLQSTEGTLAPVACLGGGSLPCRRMADCRTLPLWQGLNEVVSQYLGGFTVRDLMRTDPDGGDYII